VYDQPIVLNERQAGAAIEGVEQHNRTEARIRLELLAVDTPMATRMKVPNGRRSISEAIRASASLRR
jgi:hypothetical protein